MEVKKIELKQFSLKSSSSLKEDEVSDVPDVKLQIGLLPDVQAFHVHKSVLISNSSIFKSLLEHNRSRKEILKYKDFNPEAYELVLRLLYDTPVPTAETLSKFEDVLTIVSAFEMKDVLRRRIVTPQLVSVDNVIDILECAFRRTDFRLISQVSSSSSTNPYTPPGAGGDKQGSKDRGACWAGNQVVNTCLTFIAFFADRIFTSERFTYCSLPVLKALLDHPYHDVQEEAIFDSLKKWLKRYCIRTRKALTPSECRRLLGQSLFSIRFSQMNVNVVRSTVRNSGLLTDEEMSELLAYLVNSDPINNYGTLARFASSSKSKRGPITDVRFLNLPLPVIRIQAKCWFSIKGLSFFRPKLVTTGFPEVFGVTIHNRYKSIVKSLRRIGKTYKYDFEEPLFVTEFDGPYVISTIGSEGYSVQSDSVEWESIAPYLGIQDVAIEEDRIAQPDELYLEAICCVLYGGCQIPKDEFNSYYPWYDRYDTDNGEKARKGRRVTIVSPKSAESEPDYSYKKSEYLINE